MFESFAYGARRVLILAQDEARALDHHYIGTEHILLGLIHGGDSVAANTLESLGVTLELARDQVVKIVGQGVEPAGELPFTPRAEKVLELSLREAGDAYVGPEHLLVGLVREGDGVAAQVLVRLGVDLNSLRSQVMMPARADSDVQHPAAGAESNSPARDAIVERLDRIQDSLRDIATTQKEILRRLDGST